MKHLGDVVWSFEKVTWEWVFTSSSRELLVSRLTWMKIKRSINKEKVGVYLLYGFYCVHHGDLHISHRYYVFYLLGFILSTMVFSLFPWSFVVFCMSFFQIYLQYACINLLCFAFRINLILLCSFKVFKLFYRHLP